MLFWFKCGKISVKLWANTQQPINIFNHGTCSLQVDLLPSVAFFSLLDLYLSSTLAYFSVFLSEVLVPPKKA